MSRVDPHALPFDTSWSVDAIGRKLKVTYFGIVDRSVQLGSFVITDRLPMVSQLMFYEQIGFSYCLR